MILDMMDPDPSILARIPIQTPNICMDPDPDP